MEILGKENSGKVEREIKVLQFSTAGGIKC